MENRNFPYVIRHGQFDNEESKTQKSDIPPRHSSLLTNHKIAAADISTQPSYNRDIFMTLDNAFRQMSPKIPTVRHDPMNLTSRYTEPGKSERSLQVHRQGHDNTIPRTISRSQSQTLVTDMLDYTKLYHTVKRERCNAGQNSKENIDGSENNSGRLWKPVLLGKMEVYQK